MHKVPRELRLQGSDVYDPVMVSLGPYHHENPEFRRAEEFKYICLDWFSRRNPETKLAFYNQILANIGDIRSCYAEVDVVNKYNDEELALMMLLDACFIINFMENSIPRTSNNPGSICRVMEPDRLITSPITANQLAEPILGNNDAGEANTAAVSTNNIVPEVKVEIRNNNIEDWLDFLGLASSIQFATRDMLLVENQVPYFVIELLMVILFPHGGMRKRLLARFITWTTSADRRNGLFVVPGEDSEKPPIHLLEACWRVFQMQNEVNAAPADQEFNPITNPLDLVYKNRSVMNLKAKGIHFLRNDKSQSLKDIELVLHCVSCSGYCYCSCLGTTLYLPIRRISQNTPALLSNLIAYEVSPSTKTEPVVLSYTNLMKSLIQTSEDVKELQKRGILLNRLANDEQVVQGFKEINTFGVTRIDSFRDVKLAINRHCKAKSSTWFPVLMTTYFANPWSVIAFLAAAAILFGTVAQTVHAIWYEK